jgi:uncharacterized protein YndB with AHSA1/START domain
MEDARAVTRTRSWTKPLLERTAQGDPVVNSATTDTVVAAHTEGPGGLGDLTAARVLNAPRESVFRALIEPKHFVEFWGPAGTTTAASRVTIEPWAGGRFESVTVADEDAVEHHMKCVFLAVEEPELLSYRDTVSGVSSSVVLTDLEGTRTGIYVFHRADS